MIMSGELLRKMYKINKRTSITLPRMWLRYQFHKAGGKVALENVRMKMVEDNPKLPLLVYPEYKREGSHSSDDSPLMEEVYKVYHLGTAKAFPVPMIWIRRQQEIGDGRRFFRVRIFVEDDRLVIFPKFESAAETEDLQLGGAESKSTKEAKEQDEEQRDFDRYVAEVEGRGTRKKKDKAQ
jgi:hypothetical protein